MTTPHGSRQITDLLRTTMAEDCGVWVYAVAKNIQGDLLGDVTGVGGGPVHNVAAAGMAAAASPVSLDEFGEQALRRNLEDLAWLEATARIHHHVIETVAGHSPVVPMRLATVYHSDEAVTAMLAQRRDDFTTALTRLEARAEWGVKVYAAQRQAAGTPSATGLASHAASGPGAAYLRRRRTELSAGEQARRAAAASAEDVHAVLCGLAALAQRRPPQGQQLTGKARQMILNGAYLVDAGRSGDFALAVESLADRHTAVLVELTGPWPPYSFAAFDEPPDRRLGADCPPNEPALARRPARDRVPGKSAPSKRAPREYEGAV